MRSLVTTLAIYSLAYAKETGLDDRQLQLSMNETAIDSKRVIGGTVPPIGAYPWFARATTKNDPDKWFGCGGSLVSPSFILTAAHCLEDNFMKSGGYVVGSRCYGKGDPNKNNCGQSPSEYREASWSWTDPEYDGNFENDYAIVRLSEPITNIDPVAMNQNPNIPKKGDDVIGMGNGDTTNKGNGNPSLKLLHVELDALSQADCEKVWKPDPISSYMLCATRKGVDTCRGDSGGPLITKTKPYKLLGLSSFGGNKCADLKAPGVYARVSTRYEVLKNVICNNTPNNHPTASFCAGTTPAPAPKSPTPKPPTPKPPTPTGVIDCPVNGADCPKTTTKFQVEWLTDRFGHIDNSWYVKLKQNKVIDVKRKSIEKNTSYKWCTCMSKGKYKFKFLDKDGDGFRGDGFFKLFWNDKLMVDLTSKGNFSKKNKTLKAK